ncbi:MAG TPA: dihydrolipoyl dehydrogenase [Baekduia sp.]|uniref:dihydrolipoyl dehydrogenase n=1 Tax=Baekduia sp. TaxID=2600305 RepID=UPI002D78EDBF|nr:dihydrolipoyl dehydrogenase [Baekduia sp.]HET6509907.1 dihydrolipoyl dehydrogenase [Baekduia sp.]
MATDDTSSDVIVVGAGPGGYVAAIRSAQLGLRTAVVEREAVVGGRCLNHACIPAKAVLRSADVLSEVRGAGDFGITIGGAEPAVDFAKVVERRTGVIRTLTGGVEGLLKKHGVTRIAGEASLTPEGDVLVGGTAHVAAKAVVLATGSVRRPLPGLDFGGNVIGTEEAWALTELPTTLAVIGAGASGTEIASAYARLGTAVTLYEGLDRVLPAEDSDISKAVARGLKRQGIDVKTSTFFDPADTDDFDHVVIAAGRGPDVAALGLDAAGIALTDHGLVAVDGALRTSKPKVYAIGDLVPGPALAHKASDEGIIAVEDAAGHGTHPIAYGDIPRATFCTPNVGSFGLTEEQARAAGHDVVVGTVQYGAVGAGTVYGDRTGLIKIVGDRTYGELLGGHIVGARATELIQELASLRLAEAGYPDVARMIHGHPTLSEGVMEAARAADGWLIHG